MNLILGATQRSSPITMTTHLGMLSLTYFMLRLYVHLISVQVLDKCIKHFIGEALNHLLAIQYGNKR